MSLLGIEQKPIVLNDRFDAVGHFREFAAGAGNNTFKITDEGVIIGGTDASAVNTTTIGFDGVMEVTDDSGNVVIKIDPNG